MSAPKTIELKMLRSFENWHQRNTPRILFKLNLASISNEYLSCSNHKWKRPGLNKMSEIKWFEKTRYQWISCHLLSLNLVKRQNSLLYKSGVWVKYIKPITPNIRERLFETVYRKGSWTALTPRKRANLDQWMSKSNQKETTPGWSRMQHCQEPWKLLNGFFI